MASILVTGGSGQIGSRVLQRLDELCFPSDRLYLLKRQRLLAIDPCIQDRVEVIEDLHMQTYDFAFHLAANTHTKYNRDPTWKEKFYQDNVELTRRVADLSGKVLLVSTDNVFSSSERDCTESDMPNPQPTNTYGVTKAKAEEIVLNKHGSVLRIQTMIGVKSNLIVNRVLDAIDGKEYWPFWDDTFSRPTYFEDFFMVAKKVYHTEEGGIYHVSCNGEPLSRADIARRVVHIHKKLGLPIKREELATEHCNDPFFPRRLVLDTARTQLVLGCQFTEADVALEKHVRSILGDYHGS